MPSKGSAKKRQNQQRTERRRQAKAEMHMEAIIAAIRKKISDGRPVSANEYQFLALYTSQQSIKQVSADAKESIKHASADAKESTERVAQMSINAIMDLHTGNARFQATAAQNQGKHSTAVAGKENNGKAKASGPAKKKKSAKKQASAVAISIFDDSVAMENIGRAIAGALLTDSRYAFASHAEELNHLDGLDYANLSHALVTLCDKFPDRSLFVYKSVDFLASEDGIEVENVSVLLVPDGEAVPGFVTNANHKLLLEMEREQRAKNKRVAKKSLSIHETMDPSKKEIMRQIQTFEQAKLMWRRLEDTRSTHGSRQKLSLPEFNRFVLHPKIKGRIFLLDTTEVPPRKGMEVDTDKADAFQSIRIADCRSSMFPSRDEFGKIRLSVAKIRLMSLDGREIATFWYDSMIQEGGPVEGNEYDKTELKEVFANVLYEQDLPRRKIVKDQLEEEFLARRLDKEAELKHERNRIGSEEVKADEQLQLELKATIEQLEGEIEQLFEVTEEDIRKRLEKHVWDAMKTSFNSEREEIKEWSDKLLQGFDREKIDDIKSAKVYAHNICEVVKGVIADQGASTEELESFEVRTLPFMLAYGPAEYRFDGVHWGFVGNDIVEIHAEEDGDGGN